MTGTKLCYIYKIDKPATNGIDVQLEKIIRS